MGAVYVFRPGSSPAPRTKYLIVPGPGRGFWSQARAQLVVERLRGSGRSLLLNLELNLSKHQLVSDVECSADAPPGAFGLY